eukprot:scaffold928_cov370-Prasinococcus_capsulatus_cf.AAC.31
MRQAASLVCVVRDLRGRQRGWSGGRTHSPEVVQAVKGCTKGGTRASEVGRRACVGCPQRAHPRSATRTGQRGLPAGPCCQLRSRSAFGCCSVGSHRDAPTVRDRCGLRPVQGAEGGQGGGGRKPGQGLRHSRESAEASQVQEVRQVRGHHRGPRFGCCASRQ